MERRKERERERARPLLEGVNWKRIQTRPCAMPLIDIVCLQFEAGFLDEKVGRQVSQVCQRPEGGVGEKTRPEHVRGFDKLGNAAGERRKILENRSWTAERESDGVGDINSLPKLPRRIIALFVTCRFGRTPAFLGEFTPSHPYQSRLIQSFTERLVLGCEN